MALVSLRDVTKTYPPAKRGGEPVTAIDGVSLEIEAGDVYGIIGYSGAGKSTLVRLVNALETATSGSILVDGIEVNGLRERELRRLRLGIGMIFQQFNLFSSKSVYKNVAYPLEVARTPKNEIGPRVEELLRFVGLADKARNYPEQLSGGQKQRVGIARALATSPRILLADEATSALDPETTQEVLALLKRVNEEFGVTIVVITHEMEVIQTLATKVAVMDGGRIVEQGDVFDVFSDPQEASSQRFVATVVRGIPSPAELAVLRERHPGRIVTLSFRDGDSSQGSVFLTLAQAGVALELVYGGINDIRGRAFGHLTLVLNGDEAVIDRTLASLADASVEVTDHGREGTIDGHFGAGREAHGG
ncbi:methionine ABC transporter ATP-binding protein [Herbiconiux sp. YIM B11900]|uniref:methionine ABC transporter ATP-binding protein n=1 Tax=Herbiconiux sp. YIM B11900 TaxID=3404131 RepID=UPI003F87FA00